jgi:hypothetical protein
LIVHPDLKEVNMARLNVMLNYQIYVDIMEKDDLIKEEVIVGLMRSFDRKLIHLVTKNLLRFCKGDGFKEIVYLGLTETFCSSEFLLKIKDILINKSKDSEEFTNRFFNNLNTCATELIVSFKDFKQNKDQVNI